MADDQRPADLYDRDFYLWTQAQGEALRAKGRAQTIDWERVAEEIEDMGKSDLRECYSRVETIIEHLLKLAWSARNEPRAGWQDTIDRERKTIGLIMTASLRRSVELNLSERHERASKLAAREFGRHEPSALIDQSIRWTLPQILGEEDDPIA